MPRIAPVSPPFAEEIQASFDKLMPPGMEPLRLFRTLAHNPRVLRRVQRGGLLDPGSISVRLRELAILRTCFRCGAAYEWGVHAGAFGSQAELDDAALYATCAPDLGVHDWGREERLVLRLCDALHDSAAVSDSLWTELAECFDEAQLVELIMLAGLYHAISFVVNCSGVVPEEWARQMPEP